MKKKKVYLHLWDTAGQEDYDRLRPLSYPGADIVLLCFSLVTKSTLDNIRNKWHPEVEHFIPECPILLVGTKSDLRDSESPDPSTNEFDPVTTEEGKKMAEEIEAAGYFELSAKTGKNLKRLFRKAVELVQSNRQDKQVESKTDDNEKPEKGKEDSPKERKSNRGKKTTSSEGKGSNEPRRKARAKRTTEDKKGEDDDGDGVVMITKAKKKKQSGCELL